MDDVMATLSQRLPVTTFWALDAVLLVVVLAVVFATVVIMRNKWRLRHIPSPPSVPLLGHVPWVVLGKPWSQFTKWAQKYGSMYTIHAFTTPIVIITDVDAMKTILGTNHMRFRKDPWSYSVFGAILGKGLVTAEGRRWKMQRSRMAPHFRFESLGQLLPIFTRAATRMRATLAASRPGVPLDIGATYRRVTLEVISEASFGLSALDSGVLPRLFVSILDEMNVRVWYPHRAYMPTLTNFRHSRTIAELDEIVRQIVRTRRAEVEARGDAPVEGRSPDLLDMLLASKVVDEDAPEGTAATGMTDAQLCDELKTMLLAGHETSSMALTWALYLLVTHPEAMEKARAEVRQQLPPGDTYGSMAQYKACTYLNSVLLEALRIFNPVPTITRELVKDEVVCGKTLPGGTKIAINVWGIHHSKQVWGDDVEQFRPERFEPSEARGRHPFAFLPFSAGKRNCIGKSFALLEATVLLATTIKYFDLAMPGTASVELDRFIIPVRPKGGLGIIITPRATPVGQEPTAESK